MPDDRWKNCNMRVRKITHCQVNTNGNNLYFEKNFHQVDKQQILSFHIAVDVLGNCSTLLTVRKCNVQMAERPRSTILIFLDMVLRLAHVFGPDTTQDNYIRKICGISNCIKNAEAILLFIPFLISSFARIFETNMKILKGT